MGNLLEGLLMHNFYVTEFIGGILHPVWSHESEWVYAYSHNQTLIEMTLDELEEVPGLKMYYLQLHSSHRCMPLGGAMAYDTFTVYSFINLFGYGPEGKAGYLKTWLRDDPLFVDLKADLSGLGSKGDGLWGHFKCKMYLFFGCVYDLCCLFLLVLLTGKVFIHSVSKIQTK